jgi:hypothetical protein
MHITDADLASSPALYPHSFDVRGDRVMLVRLSAADYRLSSFLDSRMLAPGMDAAWFDYVPVAVSAERVRPKSLHMIFHTGHVGSTLLSRLLDEVPGVLGLREPHPLQTLADMADETPGGEGYQARLKTFLRLWSRGFETTDAVILKATSVACRIAPDILAASPLTKAVYLHLPAEAYITAILAGASGQADLKYFEATRHKRLSAKQGREIPTYGSAGELAAIAWMVERDSLERAKVAAGGRVMLLNFETMLADLEDNLAQVLHHFGLPPVAGQLVKSRNLSRYSKAPEQLAFSPEARAQLMRRSRDMFAAEIEKGLVLISKMQLSAA